MHIKIRLDPVKDKLPYAWFDMLPPGTRAHFLRMALARAFEENLMPALDDMEKIGRAWHCGRTPPKGLKAQAAPFEPGGESEPLPGLVVREHVHAPIKEGRLDGSGSGPSGGHEQAEDTPRSIESDVERMRRINRF